MRKFLVVIYYSFIPAVIFLDFYDEPIFLQKIGGLEAFSNIILIFYYKHSRKSKFIKTDWLLIEALLFTSAAGILLLLYKNEETLMFINTVGFYLTQFIYISIFRHQGSILPSFSVAFKEWKMILLTFLFMIGLLIILVPYVPNSLLILSFVYSTQMLILCWMAYFRPVNTRAYIEGLLGVFGLVLSNLFLTINLLHFRFPYMIAIYFIIYAVSQQLIATSIFRINNEKKDFSLPLDNQ
jgi:hypothetical protein